MSANMQAPPPPSGPPPSGPPGGGGGHGPFSDADIQQIMSDTGYSYDQVCQKIDQTGATTKEALFPQVYSGQGGIEPTEPGAEPAAEAAPAAAPAGQTVGAGVVQGGPPVGAPAAAPEGIDPEIMQRMHTMMAPKSKTKTRY